MTLSIRNAIEQARIAVGLLHRQRRQSAFRDCFDIGSIPIPAGKTKAYSGERDMSALDLIVVHITGVNGGFGVSPKAVRRWERAIIDRTVPPDLMLQIGRADHVVPGTKTGPWSIQAMAHRLALWERYRATPYHVIAAANGDVVLNRRLDQRTWHANGANMGVGLAFDLGPKDRLEDWHIATGQAAFRLMIGEVFAESAKAWDTGIRVVPHRVSSKVRRIDTGHNVWREIVLPVVQQYDSVRVDYDLRIGSGLPVPISWDPNALYDDKGRRL